jgi:hypothetical protein
MWHWKAESFKKYHAEITVDLSLVSSQVLRRSDNVVIFGLKTTMPYGQPLIKVL